MLWDGPPKTAQEVAGAVEGKKDWNYLTVRTMLYRLIKKGVVEMKSSSKLNVFSAKLTKDECMLSESRSFLRRVFDGESSPLLAHFVKHRILESKDIAELKKILSTKKNV